MTDENGPQIATGGDSGDTTARVCRYSQCGRPLPSVTRPGRKPEYCTDRTWPPEGKSCKEMAQAEQRAERATGLDVPLAAYQAAGERLAPALSEVRARLDAVLAAATDVDTAALARITEAETVMLAAVERAQTAEAQAARDAAKATDAIRQARTDRDAKTVAERMARDAEKDKERQVGEAWRKVIDAEAAQGRAEGQAAELKANLDAYIERFNKLAAEHDELRKTNKALARDNTKLDTALAAAGAAATKAAETAAAEITALRAELDQVRADAAQASTDHAAAIVGHTAAQAAAERERDQATARAEQLQAQLDELRDDLGAARGRAAVADAELARLREDNRDLNQQFGALSNDASDLRRTLAEINADRTTLREQLTALQGTKTKKS